MIGKPQSVLLYLALHKIGGNKPLIPRVLLVTHTHVRRVIGYKNGEVGLSQGRVVEEKKKGCVCDVDFCEVYLCRVCLMV